MGARLFRLWVTWHAIMSSNLHAFVYWMITHGMIWMVSVAELLMFHLSFVTFKGILGNSCFSFIFHLHGKSIASWANIFRKIHMNFVAMDTMTLCPLADKQILQKNPICSESTINLDVWTALSETKSWTNLCSSIANVLRIWPVHLYIDLWSLLPICRLLDCLMFSPQLLLWKISKMCKCLVLELNSAKFSQIYQMAETQCQNRLIH